MANKSGIPAILDGISRKLDEAFPGVNLYGDAEVAQGLDPPAFFIAVLSPTRVPELGLRYRSVNPFDVHYFPAADGGNAELLDVAERLYEALEYIVAEGKPVRGTDLSYELADGVLHFFVTYRLTGILAAPAAERIQNIETRIGEGL